MSGLPMTLWGEAVRHTVWLKNCTSTKALDGKSPLEATTSCCPDLSQLQEWGCHVWVHDANTSKLEPHAQEGCWLGFDDSLKGCWVYWPTTWSVSVKHNVYFVLPPALRFEGEHDDVDLDAPSDFATGKLHANVTPTPVEAPPPPE